MNNLFYVIWFLSLLLVLTMIYLFLPDFMLFLGNADFDLIFHNIFSFFLIMLVIYISWKIYQYFYFKSNDFLEIKKKISNNSVKCNELNQHIENLKKSPFNFQNQKVGLATQYDNSLYNYRRPKFQELMDNENVYNCSRIICSNAHKSPFKYLCKYFEIEETEENLIKFETMLNNFSAVEDGKVLLKRERDRIVLSVKNKISFLIYTFSKKKLIRKLGFNDIDFSIMYFPIYSFVYVSSGGYSSLETEIELNIENLNDFVVYLNSKIKYRNSVLGQRALMTTKLREEIKERDNYTCRICGNSVFSEPNLLLEVDHIIPLSKNGKTTTGNLQVLCWKCNRKKSNKIL